MNSSFSCFRLAFVALLAGAPALMACASAQRPPSSAYVRAQPVTDSPPAPVPTAAPAAPAAPPPVSGQMKPMPPPPARSTLALLAQAAATTEQIVAEANRQASQGPARETYFNAIAQYSFEPGTLYQVYASPMRITDIVLEPGEYEPAGPCGADERAELDRDADH